MLEIESWDWEARQAREELLSIGVFDACENWRFVKVRGTEVVFRYGRKRWYIDCGNINITFEAAFEYMDFSQKGKIIWHLDLLN